METVKLRVLINERKKAFHKKTKGKRKGEKGRRWIECEFMT
jgi:hypothetical protein